MTQALPNGQVAEGTGAESAGAASGAVYGPGSVGRLGTGPQGDLEAARSQLGERLEDLARRLHVQVAEGP